MSTAHKQTTPDDAWTRHLTDRAALNDTYDQLRAATARALRHGQGEHAHQVTGRALHQLRALLDELAAPAKPATKNHHSEPRKEQR